MDSGDAYASPPPHALPPGPLSSSAPRAPEHALDESAFGEPPRTASAARNLRRRVGGALAAVAAVVAKFFATIKGLLLLVPKLKLLTTAGTAFVSIAAYSLVFGWTFAVGFVVLLLVHEMGHVIQLRREGIKASAPMFIPFLGAVIGAKSLGDNAVAEARVGLAGPILGSIGSAACILVWHATGSDIWRALACTRQTCRGRSASSNRPSSCTAAAGACSGGRARGDLDLFPPTTTCTPATAGPPRDR